MNKTQHPFYNAWYSIKQRCFNPKHKGYATHGARGIAVDRGWRINFENFTRDMGPRPDGFTLQRYDTDKDYAPGNCFWGESANQPRTGRWKTRLTDTQVGEIRWLLARHAKQLALAIHYNVSATTLYKINRTFYRAHCLPTPPHPLVINALVPEIWR